MKRGPRVPVHHCYAPRGWHSRGRARWQLALETDGFCYRKLNCFIGDFYPSPQNPALPLWKGTVDLADSKDPEVPLEEASVEGAACLANQQREGFFSNLATELFFPRWLQIKLAEQCWEMALSMEEAHKDRSFIANRAGILGTCICMATARYTYSCIIRRYT